MKTGSRQRFLAYVLAACAFSGCAATSTKSLDFQEGKFGGYILGVDPNGTFLNVYPGRIEEGIYHGLFFGSADFEGTVNDGYVVGRADAGTRLAIARIGLKGRFSANMHWPCGPNKAVTFEVSPQKLIYLGHFEFSEDDGGRLSYAIRKDIGAAARYIEINYPEFGGTVVLGEIEYFQSSESCSSVTIIVTG